MKKWLLLLLLVFPLTELSAEELALDSVDVDVFDKASVQRGAKVFIAHCLGCHSAKHLRYSRLARDMGISDEEIKQSYLPKSAKIQDGMESAMNSEHAERWFGIKTPDLSVIARVRSPDWLYSYLRGFYLDDSKPYGVNNVVFKDVAMPNVLWSLQGLQAAVIAKKGKEEILKGLEVVQPGSMSKAEFDGTIRDLVNFLVYLGEPAQLERKALGKYVILFLIVFLIFAYRLKKEYWKDVH